MHTNRAAMYALCSCVHATPHAALVHATPHAQQLLPGNWGHVVQLHEECWVRA